MSLEPHGAAFLCPECGSRQARVHTMTEPIHDPADPWTSVFQTHTCAACGYEIPAHLGESWDGRSAEDAQGEWRETYRDRRTD